jgi:hypothetical protein
VTVGDIGATTRPLAFRVRGTDGVFLPLTPVVWTGLDHARERKCRCRALGRRDETTVRQFEIASSFHPQRGLKNFARPRPQISGHDLTSMIFSARRSQGDVTLRNYRKWKAQRIDALMHSISLPTCNEKSSSRMTPCATRRSHFYRAKFIPKTFGNDEQSFRRFQQWRWVCSNQNGK